MNIEMLILGVLGIQTALIMGTIGLVAMLFSGRMAALEAQQRADTARLEAKLDKLIWQTRPTREMEAQP